MQLFTHPKDGANLLYYIAYSMTVECVILKKGETYGETLTRETNFALKMFKTKEGPAN